MVVGDLMSVYRYRDATVVGDGWFEKLTLSRFNAVVTICVVKSAIVIGISLYLTNWWTYSGGNSVPRNQDIVESCANPVVGNCYSFCGDVSQVDVQITDDDIAFDDYDVPPVMHVTERTTTSSYCIANLPGHCAYDFWLVFTLVPLVLHLVQLNLQLVSWWYYKEFTPQQKQYDTVILYLYPQAYVKDTTRRVVITRKGQGEGSGEGYDYQGMLQQLQTPTFYSIFAFIEIFTVVYVWGELQFPSTYCGSVRPLSLYYYPIFMTLLDITKFNIYVSAQYVYSGMLLDGLLALFNIEMFVSNLWITTVLAVMFALNLTAATWSAVVILLCGAPSDDSVVPKPKGGSNGDGTDVEAVVAEGGEHAAGTEIGSPLHPAGTGACAGPSVTNKTLGKHVDDEVSDDGSGRGLRLSSLGAGGSRWVQNQKNTACKE